MTLFYQKISTGLHGSSLVAKCSNCHNEYPAQHRKCIFCGSELRDWVIDLFDESHHNKFKRR